MQKLIYLKVLEILSLFFYFVSLLLISKLMRIRWKAKIKSIMGIDSMRVGGGRCSPLLVGGLFIACLMLICNWWTLSSENLDLVRQIDELNEQLKIR